MADIVRVLVVDDHPIVRRGLVSLLEIEPDMLVVGEAEDGWQAVEKARLFEPDVILMDLVMPGKSGLEAIAEIRRDDPQARILVLTSFSEEERVFAAIKAGALGYILKDTYPQELLNAIRRVYRGEVSLSAYIARQLVSEISRTKESPSPETTLTGRELEVLKLATRGLSNKEIAERLKVSEGTVRSHISNILGKLHLANRTQAVLYALREEMFDLDEDTGKD